MLEAEYTFSYPSPGFPQTGRATALLSAPNEIAYIPELLWQWKYPSEPESAYRDLSHQTDTPVCVTYAEHTLIGYSGPPKPLDFIAKQTCQLLEKTAISSFDDIVEEIWMAFPTFKSGNGNPIRYNNHNECNYMSFVSDGGGRCADLCALFAHCVRMHGVPEWILHAKSAQIFRINSEQVLGVVVDERWSTQMYIIKLGMNNSSWTSIDSCAINIHKTARTLVSGCPSNICDNTTIDCSQIINSFLASDLSIPNPSIIAGWDNVKSHFNYGKIWCWPEHVILVFNNQAGLEIFDVAYQTRWLSGFFDEASAIDDYFFNNITYVGFSWISHQARYITPISYISSLGMRTTNEDFD